MSDGASVRPAPPRRDAFRGLSAVALPIAVVLVLLVVLEVCKRSGWLPITVPAPSEVAAAFGRSYGDLFYHMGPTVLSALSGFLIATVIALTLGAVAITWRRTESSVLKFGIIVDSIPLIALTPILAVWLGNGLSPRIVMATMAALLPMIVGAVQGLKAVDRNVSDLFHILAANRWQRLRKLALPSALPYLFAAFKIAAPLSLLGALIAEWISADRGLGIELIYAQFSFDIPLSWLIVVAICILATLAYGLVALAERLVVGAPLDSFDLKGDGRG